MPVRPISPSHRGGIAAPVAFLVVLFSGLPGMGASPKDPLQVPPKSVLVATAIEAGPGLTATLVEYFTGEQSERNGINLLLGLHRAEGDRKRLVASRDWNAEAGGFVSRGSLQVIDLDRDGTSEILVEYHQNEKPGSVRMKLDVLRITPNGLNLSWSGPVRVDTTSKELNLAPAERERSAREIDYAKTAAARGKALVFHRTVSMAAGLPFDPPRVVEEEVGALLSSAETAEADPAGPQGGGAR